MSAKEEFIEIYRANVHREGADALLDYLENKSDFFTSPASARYHGAYVGGLCEHSVNVYHCLREYLARERVQELYGVEAPDESVAVSALLHDLYHGGKDANYLRHSRTHPLTALHNAMNATTLSAKEQNIIASHMWPLCTARPRSREAWLVNAVDTLTAFVMYWAATESCANRLDRIG